MMLPILLFLLHGPSSADNDYHAMVITKESLCTIPDDNGPLMTCTTSKHEKSSEGYQQIDCNQDRCSCAYTASSFQQNCVFNQSFSFVRNCSDFERNCTLFNNVYGGQATCQERYGSCKIVSQPLPSRFGVGYPQYNLPICYPGLRAAKDGCNYTSTSCSGDLTIEFENTVRSSLLSCKNKCVRESTSCTNYTKNCNDSLSYWEETERAAAVEETCRTITNKCIEQRKIKWIPENSVNKRAMQHSAHQQKQQSIVAKSYDCSAKTNLTISLRKCKASINENMKYKAECQFYGVMVTEYLFKTLYAANTTVATVTSYLAAEWDGVIKELCRLDCFRALTRELRFCIADLPIQNILPGITTDQFQQLMYASEDLLCASTKEKEIKETCVVYLNGQSELSKNVMLNMSDSCSTELAQWEEGPGRITCTQKCKNYLKSHVINRHDKPGCCLADVIKFRKKSSPWMEMLSPSVFKKNYLLNLVRQCSLTESLGSCTEVDVMHPAVIFVIAVIGVFSVALIAGVIVFIVVFYRQMEYEGYKKGFLANIVTA